MFRLELEGIGGSVSQEPVVSAMDTTPEIITMPSRFEKVQDRGYIDVWWLYDDGGKEWVVLSSYI